MNNQFSPLQQPQGKKPSGASSPEVEVGGQQKGPLAPKHKGSGLISNWQAKSTSEPQPDNAPMSVSQAETDRSGIEYRGQGLLSTQRKQVQNPPSPAPVNPHYISNPAPTPYVQAERSFFQPDYIHPYSDSSFQVEPDRGQPAAQQIVSNPPQMRAANTYNTYYDREGIQQGPGTVPNQRDYASGQGSANYQQQANPPSVSTSQNSTPYPNQPVGYNPGSNGGYPNQPVGYNPSSNGGYPNQPAGYNQRGSLNANDYATVLSPPSGAAYPAMGHPMNNTAYRNTPPPAMPFMPPGGGMPPFKVKKSKRRFPIWARVIVAIMAILIVGTGSAYGYYQYNYADAINNITGHQAIHSVNVQTTDANGNIQSQTGNTNILSGKRINILLLGSDTDGKNGNNGVGGSPLAQTDIIVTIDPTTKYIGMLSIPRDLKVTIPNNGSGKMDFAFSYGFQAGGKDFNNQIGNGAGLTEDTIAYNFGIHIDFYAWVGLAGFIKVIDTAGGVDVDVIHPMTDDLYPNDVNQTGNAVFGYKRLYIGPGPQHLNGVQALEYVRTRHSDLVGDFGRSARQQQVLSQLKTKLVNPDTIQKAPELLKDLQDTLKTDLDVAKMGEMANFARGINTNTIDRITLGPPTYAAPIADATGDFAPICGAVKVQIEKMFAVAPKCIPQYAQQAAISPGTTVAPVALSDLPALHSTAKQSQVPVASGLESIVGQPQSSPLYNPADFSATHNLLNWMFAVVFGSVDALKV